jgi:hypothetical protein
MIGMRRRSARSVVLGRQDDRSAFSERIKSHDFSMPAEFERGWCLRLGKACLYRRRSRRCFDGPWCGQGGGAAGWERRVGEADFFSISTTEYHFVP